jgi:predicted secreted protein
LPPEEADKEVSVDDSYAGKEVEVAVGGSLTVHLKSDPATGFEWELVTITDETVLEEVEHEYVGPEAEAPEEAGGEEEPAPAPAPPPPPEPVLPKEEWWTFKALKQGESIISMEYSQPWEGGTKAARTFVLTVIVK